MIYLSYHHKLQIISRNSKNGKIMFFTIRDIKRQFAKYFCSSSHPSIIFIKIDMKIGLVNQKKIYNSSSDSTKYFKS